MADKYKALRDALADDRLEYGFWFVEKDHLLFEDSTEGHYHGIDPQDQVLIKAATPSIMLNLLAERDALEEALVLALVYWKERQQRYKNRSPVWVEKARAALAQANGEPHD